MMTRISQGEPFDDNGDTCLPLVSQDVALLVAKVEALSDRIDELQSVLATVILVIHDDPEMEYRSESLSVLQSVGSKVHYQVLADRRQVCVKNVMARLSALARLSAESP